MYNITHWIIELKTSTFTVQAGLILHQGYAPEKHGTNGTQNFHLKQCFFLQLGVCQPHPVQCTTTMPLVDIQTRRVYMWGARWNRG